jgi:ElaB/YqjD/DUF883 family membrane-anchored ribosome-binding protein
MLEQNLKTSKTDLKSLIQDAQDLFREATSTSGVRAEELRNKGAALLDNALSKAQDAQTAALDAGKEMVDNADGYVRENPWAAVAVSAGVGLLIGMMISSSNKR